MVCGSLDGEEEDHDGAEHDGRVGRALPVDERVHDSLRRPHLEGGGDGGQRDEELPS